MTKKKAKRDDNGWEFAERGDGSWGGEKLFPGHQIRYVSGQDEDRVREAAAEVDRIVAAREAGIAEQASAQAAELRAQADALEGK